MPKKRSKKSSKSDAEQKSGGIQGQNEIPNPNLSSRHREDYLHRPF